MLYDISWSGGKDSTASIILAHEKGIPIRQINYCRIMYNEYIPADLPVMVDFVDRAIGTFLEWGYKVNIIKPQKTAVDLSYMRYKRSKKPGRNGKYYGISSFCRGRCQMSGEKSYALNKDSHISIVGIASDETERLKRLGANISLLQRFDIAESETFRICSSYGLLSPLYEIDGLHRSGCFFCPNVTKRGIEYIKRNYPKLYEIALSLVGLCEYDISHCYSNWINEYFRSTGKKEGKA